MGTDGLAVTAFAHPYPAIRGHTKEIVKYTREDGVELTGTLYLPKCVLRCDHKGRPPTQP